MLDSAVIEAFRALAEAEGIGYQTLINRTLRNSLVDGPVGELTLRRVIREELGAWRLESSK
jgi:hypothetical protein